jgi:hypothetical protein
MKEKYPGSEETRKKYIEDIERVRRGRKVNRVAIIVFALVILVPIALVVIEYLQGK